MAHFKNMTVTVNKNKVESLLGSIHAYSQVHLAGLE